MNNEHLHFETFLFAILHQLCWVGRWEGDKLGTFTTTTISFIDTKSLLRIEAKLFDARNYEGLTLERALLIELDRSHGKLY